VQETDLLFEAFAIVKPSIVSSVPRLFNKLYSEYQSALARIKLEAGGGNSEHEKGKLAQKELLLHFKQSFGGATKMVCCPAPSCVRACVRVRSTRANTHSHA
jgi:hypothetical protein